MQKVLIRVSSTCAIVLSGLWFYREGGFEPAITALAGLAGLISSFYDSDGSGVIRVGDTEGKGAADAPGAAPGFSVSAPAAQPVPSKPVLTGTHSAGIQDAERFLAGIKAAAHQWSEKRDHSYYEIYRRALHQPAVFDNPGLAERWRLEVLTTYTLLHLHGLCREQIRLRASAPIPAGGAGHLWELAPDGDAAVNHVVAAVHALVRGEDQTGSEMLRGIGMGDAMIGRLTQFSRQSARRIFDADGAMNRKRRGYMEEMLRIDPDRRMPA